MLNLREEKNSVLIDLKVIPGASKDEVVGILGQALKIKVTTAPENGKANKACEKLLAKFFQTKKQAVTIVSGMTSTTKTVKIENISKETISRIINETISGKPKT